MKGKVSEKQEVVLESGEKKLVNRVIKGGGLFGVPDKQEWAGILNHVLLARRVAVYLAQELKAAGEDSDLKLVSEAASLHDIDRRREDERIWYDHNLKAAGSHAQEGARILIEDGFSKEIAEIVGAHHFPQEKKELDTWEKKVVIYAELRATQKIISFEDRMDDLEKRWVPNKLTQKELDTTRNLVKNIEQEMFSKLVIEPNDILDIPMPLDERYLRTAIEHDVEEEVIEYFRDLETREDKNKSAT